MNAYGILVPICILVLSVESRSLWDVICEDSARCPSNRVTEKPKMKKFIKSSPNLGSPSEKEFARWQNYERDEPGTGLHPDSGPGFGPGLGNINILTGIGVQHPYGSLLLRRDLDIFMGGSGRSGGRAFGWGNGAPFIQGAAPWAYPL